VCALLREWERIIGGGLTLVKGTMAWREREGEGGREGRREREGERTW
jgi:hypothetical protein